MQPKTYVIYHSADLDGLFCYEIAKAFYAGQKPFETTDGQTRSDFIEFIGWNHGEPVPEIEPGSEVVMLDLGIEALIQDAIEKSISMTWIDHHENIVTKYKDIEMCGSRLPDVAACRQAFQFFKKKSEIWNGTAPLVEWSLPTSEEYLNRAVYEPAGIRLAGEYDVWDHRDPNCMPFQLGAKLDTKALHIFLTDDAHTFAHTISQGGLLLAEKIETNKKLISDIGFDAIFQDRKVLACNVAHSNSQVFDSMMKDEHELLVAFSYNGRLRKWKFSLYQNPKHPEIDVSKIARKCGGNGHRGAAGFECSFISIESADDGSSYIDIMP
jgi:hypothetical protein